MACHCCGVPFCGCPNVPRTLYLTVEGCSGSDCSNPDGTYTITYCAGPTTGSEPCECGLVGGWTDAGLGLQVPCLGATCFGCVDAATNRFALNSTDGSACGFLGGTLEGPVTSCDPFLWTVTVPAGGTEGPPDCDCSLTGPATRCCHLGDLITLTVSEVPPP